MALTAWKRLPARLKWSSKEQQTPAQEQLEATKASEEPRAAAMQVRRVQKVAESRDHRRLTAVKKPQEYEHTVHTQPEPDMRCSSMASHLTASKEKLAILSGLSDRRALASPPMSAW